MTLNINRKNHTIEMPSKKYALAASKFGSDEYNELQQARRDYPTYAIVTKKRANKKSQLRGLTYDVMAEYIANHDDDKKTFKSQFDFLRGESDNVASSASYAKIRSWFLDTFSDYGKFPTKQTVVEQ